MQWWQAWLDVTCECSVDAKIEVAAGSFVLPAATSRIARKIEEHWRARTHASGTQSHI